MRRQSVPIAGSLDRHNKMLSYKTFERSLTTLLATALNDKDLVLLVNMLKHAWDDETRHDQDFHDALEEQPVLDPTGDIASHVEGTGVLPDCAIGDHDGGLDEKTNKLEIIHLYKLLEILEEDLGRRDM